MFFTRRLIEQRQASPHTIASYRDTFRLLLHFAQRELKKPPSELRVEDIDPSSSAPSSAISRTNVATMRGPATRLAAIRSFFQYIALPRPQHAAMAQRVLAMPSKRYTRRPVAFLDHDEIAALLCAPDPTTRVGRRDRALLLVAVRTGLRASELINLRCGDVQLGVGAHLRCHGKGRKERYVPLAKDAASELRAWMKERRGEPDDRVFLNQRGRALTHDSLDYLLAGHLATARGECPSLRKKRITPHSLRHTAAMALPAKPCRPGGHRIVAWA